MKVWMGPGLALAITLLAGSRTAQACACCTNEGQRSVGTRALDSGMRQQIEGLRFSGKATLFAGEGDVEAVKGIATPSTSYEITTTWLDGRLTFALRDKAGRSGTLALAMPNSISVFEVDPRGGPDNGQGPMLYKEWKLSAPAAATGVFAAGAAARHVLTLIVQGHGNSCTDAGDFAHWTLVMQGPQANYSLFGDLVTTR